MQANGVTFGKPKIDLDEPASALGSNSACLRLRQAGNTNAVRVRIAELICDSAGSGVFGNLGLGDETLEMVREQFRKIAEDHMEDAHKWHLADDLIPLEVIHQLSDLGIFGLTVPEEFGGLEMGKTAMCVVTEELSRGYIGLGSLGTRSEIAAELIRLGGTQAQKQYWLPRISSGEILPTAVFTEPGQRNRRSRRHQMAPIRRSGLGG